MAADDHLLAARLDVHDVIVGVALDQDARDWASLAGRFDANAIYDHPRGRLEGADAIVERARAALAPLDACQHLIGSVLVTVDDDTATAISYFQAQHVRAVAPGGPLYTIAGTYRDRLARRDGLWLITHRAQSYAWRDGNPAVIIR